MIALLGWIGARRWLLELLAAAAIVVALLAYHRHVYDTGIRAQQAADAAASAKAEVQAAIATQAAQDAANRAEESYREEIASNAAAAAAHPLGRVRLCDDPASSSVSEASATDAGNAGAGAAAGSVQGVPRRDPRLRQERPGPDLERLLDAWADKADGVSATLREFQGRQP